MQNPLLLAETIAKSYSSLAPVLKHLTNLTEKYLCRSLFSKSCKVWARLQRVFLCIFENFPEQLFREQLRQNTPKIPRWTASELCLLL